MIVKENLAIENYSDGITLKDKESVYSEKCIHSKLSGGGLC